VSAEPIRHLQLVDGPLFDRETGEPAEGAPLGVDALRAIEQLRAFAQNEADEKSMLERDIAGKRLRILELERDREAEALRDPNRARVEFLHGVWRKACRRRRPLHYADRERMGRAVESLGFRLCVAAIAGAAYDPNHSKPRKNGKRDRYDDLELIFREYRHVHQFAERVPTDWSPDPAKLAALGGVEVEIVVEWLGKPEE
jgi:hypothetical protein